MPRVTMAHVARPGTCIGENTIALIVDRGLDAATGADHAHIAECADCRSAIDLALRVSRSGTAPEPEPESRREARETLASGTQVGRYVLLEKLGSGGMGTVYAARDPALDRRIALKLLRPGLARGNATEQLRTRLLREAQAMAKLSHPDVITVYDVGTHEDQLFIAMELVPGGTLRDWCLRASHTWGEITRAYARAGRGLAAAHAAGLVHRDFKPDNVLVGRDGRVRVTDFGLARALREGTEPDPPASGPVSSVSALLTATLTRQGAVVGTPAYMAPEQLRGENADVRADVFSFCASLYEGLYGERPFAASGADGILAAIVAQDLRPAPSSSAVPTALRRALLVGLRSDPAQRWPSLASLLDELDRLAASPPRRRWGRIAAVVAGVGATAAVALAVARLPRSSGDAPPRASRDPETAVSPTTIAPSASEPGSAFGTTPPVLRAPQGSTPATAAAAAMAPRTSGAPARTTPVAASSTPRSTPVPSPPSSSPSVAAAPAAAAPSAAPTVGKNGAWILQ